MRLLLRFLSLGLLGQMRRMCGVVHLGFLRVL